MVHSVNYYLLLLGCCIATVYFKGRWAMHAWVPTETLEAPIIQIPSRSAVRGSPNAIASSTTNSQRPLVDVKASPVTPRLKAFQNPAAFPVPRFHGCTSEKGLCRFSNVCFSHRDFMLVPDVQGLREGPPDPYANGTTPWYEPGSRYSESIVEPRQPRVVPFEVYRDWTNVYFAKSIFVANCWQNKQGEYNPAHMLMGEGKLFVHASGHWDEEEGKKASDHEAFDLILYHQCTTTESWPWGSFVGGILWDDAVAKGSIRPPRRDATLYLPYVAGEGPPQGDDLVVCGESVQQGPYYPGAYLDGNHYFVAQRWQGLVDNLVASTPAIKESLEEHTPMAAPSVATADAKAPTTCTRKLRIAAWQRTEGSSLRLFRNMDDLRKLVAEYSDHPLRVLTANSKTPPEEQVAIFRAFDVLITPHGSHLVNMIFSPQRSVYLEVSPVFYDMGPWINGLSYAKDWVHSFGHAPYNNTKLAKKLPDCLNDDASSDGKCPLFPTRSEFIHSDMVVNITIFRKDLEKAIAALCPPEDVAAAS